MKHRRTAILILAMALLAIPLGSGAWAARDAASCWTDPVVGSVGEEVTFSATNLTGGQTRVEMISGTVGNFYHSWSLGNGSSHSFEWTFERAGTYAAVFSKDSSSGIFRMKCDVYVTVV